MKIQIEPFFHKQSSTISYIVYHQESKQAFIIDSALDFDIESGKVTTIFADEQLDFLRLNCLELIYIFETHAHADHLTAASYLREKTRAKVAVSANVIGVQKHFKTFFNDKTLIADGRCFDLLLEDAQEIPFSESTIKIMSVAGHTNDSIALLIEENAFVGDTLFMPDQGTARCDFPGGNASALFNSVVKLHSLPDHFKLWMCHDYQPEGRKLAYQCSVKESREQNHHINNQSTLSEFVKIRESRDKALPVPKLLYPAIQVNIHAGELPLSEDNGTSYIKVPLTKL